MKNKRLDNGRVGQRHVLYLGEINSSPELAWRRSIEVFDSRARASQRLALCSADHGDGLVEDESVVRLRLAELRLCRPRQWGACWLALQLWHTLELDQFWAARLPPSRKGTRWDQGLLVLVVYRLLAPGSEWCLHREWYGRSALGDLLGTSDALAEASTRYRCHDQLLAHKPALFSHLVARWRALFHASFDVLLYDVTSTYFECDPPRAPEDKRRFGHSRDKRSDCVQVVIALVITSDGLPLAYEVLAGNTADKTTLREFLRTIEGQYGKVGRVWVMDRGIPTEAVLEELRQSDPPIHYLVGTPKGRLTCLEQALLEQPWHAVRPGVEVKLRPYDEELSVFTQSADRVAKERAMRRRQLTWLWSRLKEVPAMTLSRDHLLMKLGAAQHKAPAAWRLVEVTVEDQAGSFRYALRRDKLCQVRRREGRYLLRPNLTETDPAKLWHYYLQLVAVEEAFRNLKKGDLAIRPIYHQTPNRLDAHIFIVFLAYWDC